MLSYEYCSYILSYLIAKISPSLSEEDDDSSVSNPGSNKSYVFDSSFILWIGIKSGSGWFNSLTNVCCCILDFLT